MDKLNFLLILLLLSSCQEVVKQNEGTTIKEIESDYFEGIEKSKEKDKPILLWFSGTTCKSNRENQSLINSSDEIAEILNESFITTILYVDDKTKLDEIQTVERDGKQVKLKTIGNKWAHLEITKYKCRRQPFMTIIDASENRIADYGDGIVEEKPLIDFLKDGVKLYRSSKE